ncbi:MAG: YiiX/YebB-like N1pC/P60 family cysteine hydrolase [Hyphomicrobiaceae bacterium]
MSFFDSALDRIGRWIAGRLESPQSGYEPFTSSDPKTLRRFLEPGDILLVEGNQKVSTAIKYLTQSTWSHAAIFVGNEVLPENHKLNDKGEENVLIEANIGEGVIACSIEKYSTYNTRICRPIGLTHAHREAITTFMTSKLGLTYDTRNIWDLARYLFPTPPVPTRWRRKMIALGSGEPSKAICSSLLAQAFQNVKYPILPTIERFEAETDENATVSGYTKREVLTIRHHSLFTPRDFDLSPYFRVIKPTIELGFDYQELEWTDAPATEGPFGYRRPVHEREPTT